MEFTENPVLLKNIYSRLDSKMVSTTETYWLNWRRDRHSESRKKKKRSTTTKIDIQSRFRTSRMENQLHISVYEKCVSSQHFDIVPCREHHHRMHVCECVCLRVFATNHSQSTEPRGACQHIVLIIAPACSSTN